VLEPTELRDDLAVAAQQMAHRNLSRTM
jgi:hypothetical protein